jgi:N-acetylmuramic acid 6-phosphate etherase
VHYFGAGTSGRLAVIDAAELLPTFNAPAGLFVAHHAGGPAALVAAVENVEDDVELGARDAAALGRLDVVVGLTASGRTPYVAGALAVARERGALTLLVTANPQAELAADVDVLLAVDTGPEVITGSTRLKAGTAQKLVLNGFSTAIMVRLGRTWSNLMVDVVATNAKLRGRVIRILREASGADEQTARAALEQSGGELKTALLTLLAEIGPDDARAALARHDGSVAQALRALQNPHGTAPHEQETSR